MKYKIRNEIDYIHFWNWIFSLDTKNIDLNKKEFINYAWKYCPDKIDFEKDKANKNRINNFKSGYGPIVTIHDFVPCEKILMWIFGEYCKIVKMNGIYEDSVKVIVPVGYKKPYGEMDLLEFKMIEGTTKYYLKRTLGKIEIKMVEDIPTSYDSLYFGEMTFVPSKNFGISWQRLQRRLIWDYANKKSPENLKDCFLNKFLFTKKMAFDIFSCEHKGVNF